MDAVQDKAIVEKIKKELKPILKRAWNSGKKSLSDISQVTFERMADNHRVPHALVMELAEELWKDM